MYIFESLSAHPGTITGTSAIHPPSKNRRFTEMRRRDYLINTSSAYIYGMKKMSYPVIAVLMGVLCLGSGCTKTNPAVFTWYYMNTHYVADSSSVYETGSPADDRIVASCSTAGLTALGIDGGSKLEVGSYTFHNINNTGLPYMFYDYVGTLYSQSGTLNITYRSSTRMSGNFTVTYTDGSTMTGSFTDVPIE